MFDFWWFMWGLYVIKMDWIHMVASFGHVEIMTIYDLSVLFQDSSSIHCESIPAENLLKV